MDTKDIIIMAVIAALAGGYVVASLILLRFPQLLHRKKRLRFRPVHISHRGGAAENCENTITAFKHAVAQGSQMLELDVHLTRDGQVVVSHDGDLKHKFGVDANIADLDFKDLPLYKPELKVDFKPGCTVTCGPDRCIPTLESVFTQFPNTPINIDLKVYNETLFEKVHKLIKDYQREDLTIWGGRGTVTTKYLLKLDPNIPVFVSFGGVIRILVLFYTGLLPFINIEESTLEIIMPSIALSPGNFPINMSWKFKILLRLANALLMSPMLFRHLERRGIQTYLWVLNEEEHFEAAFKMGVAGVMTDYPTRLSQYLEAHPWYAAHWGGVGDGDAESQESDRLEPKS